MNTSVLEHGHGDSSIDFPAWPIWDRHERDNLMKALRAAQWGTLGNMAMAFAARFAESIGVGHAIAVNSGTQAMQMLIGGAGIGYGDEVIMPAYACAPVAEAIANMGATPVFADVHADDANISPEEAERLISGKTRAVIAVHLGGRLCDMQALRDLAKRHSVLLFEDCSHAHGASVGGRMAGSIGDGAVFSFGEGMNMTCGEGGVITTDSDSIFAGSWHLHNSGRALEGSSEFGGTVLMGSNGRMAEWEAAILGAQMDRLDAQNATRRKNAAALADLLRELRPAVFLREGGERIAANAFQSFGIRLDLKRLKCSRDAFIEELVADGIPVASGFQSLSRMGMLRTDYFAKNTGHSCDNNTQLPPNAEMWAESSIWLPGRVLLGTSAHTEKIAASFRKAVRKMAV